MKFTPDAVGAVLDRFPGRRCCVAFSGGLDSTVLLHALAALRDERALELRAVHVDHGLHADAASWADHCIRVAATLSVPCTVVRVAVEPDGRGLEAAARDARYAALAAEAGDGEAVMTGQHADDQAETVLLALLRGSGPAGLAAMPEAAPLGAGVLLRPLLAFTRDALADWAAQQQLSWIDDPSNEHVGFARNRLRLEVMPRLREHWPGFARAFGRSASLAADADALLSALAEADLAALADDDTLDADGLCALGDARARNVLRHWIAQRGLPPPPYERLVEAVRQARDAASDRVPTVDWPGAVLRRWRGRVYVAGDAPARAATIELVPAPAGLDAARIRAATVEVRTGDRGERLCVRPGGGHRQVAHLLAEAGVPPWERGAVPLLFADGELVAVGDRFLAADWLAADGAPALMPVVRPRFRVS